MRTGIIYKVTSSSGKVYIGQTIQRLSRRKDRHFSDAFDKNCGGYNSKFPRAIRKYGRGNFEWDILYNDIPEKYLNHMEIITITWYDSYNIGYNSTLGGGGCVGRKVSEETKKKISETLTGNSRPELSGDKHPLAKLTWDGVREIRLKYASKKYTHSALAKEYSISATNVRRVVHNKTWIEQLS